MPTQPSVGAVAAFGRPGRALLGNASRPPSRAQVHISQAATVSVDVYVDRLMLDMFSTVRSWVVGTGVPLVSVVELAEEGRIVPYRNATMTLLQAG